MRIEDSFNVNLPVEQAWNLFLDVERVAPCMPGAQIDDASGDEYRGVVKIKLGAITARYNGWVRIAEVDEVGYRLVLRAEGRETRRQGDAAATVVATLRPAANGSTNVGVDIDLTIAGRIAQVGRATLVAVTTKLLGDFARCLDASLRRKP